MNSSMRTQAAIKANRTRQVRNKFISRFSEKSLRILAALRRRDEGRRIPASLAGFNSGSVAAVKANLTRGAYRDFVTVTANGNWSDKMNLLTVR